MDTYTECVKFLNAAACLPLSVSFI